MLTILNEQAILKVILNPYAGRWRAKSYIDRLQAYFDAQSVAYELVLTTEPGEATAIARQAAEAGHQKVVAVGGDGTVSEVVNGLVAAAGDDQAGDLGIIPVGTANDLADMLKIPRQFEKACQRVVAGQTRTIDVGIVNDHFFSNNSALGLEPVVTENAETIRLIDGASRYILAALHGIARNPGWQATIEWDTGSYEGPVSLISVGNSPRTGGAFWMTPKAELDDGKLDVVFAPTLNRLQLLRLLPMTFRGKHIDHKAVTSLRVTFLKVTIESTPIQADGELIDRQATEVSYKVLPQKLRVIV